MGTELIFKSQKTRWVNERMTSYKGTQGYHVPVKGTLSKSILRKFQNAQHHNLWSMVMWSWESELKKYA